jgi:hypothetical protein
MRPNHLAAVATIAVVAFGATACKSSSHASTPSPTQNLSTTQTQAGSASAGSTSTSTPAAASTSPASSSSASPSAPAPAAAGGGAINACSLLTGAQVSSLSGGSFGSGPGVASVLATGIDQCAYAAGPTSSTGIGMDLIVYEPSSGLTLASLQPQLSSEGTIMQVSGVGDKAEFAGVDLDVMAGKYVFDVQAAGGTNLTPGVIAMAKVVVGALASK